MRVLVNAVSIKEGGSLIVFEQLLKRMRRQRRNVDWAIAVHPTIRKLWQEQSDFALVDVGDVDSNLFAIPRWYELTLPAAIRRLDADLLFSMTNYLPWRRLTVPTVLLVQHAGHFSERFDELARGNLRRPDRIAAWRLKTHWVERSVRAASEVTVQTAALADAVATRTGRPRARIHPISHGTGAVTQAQPPRKRANGAPLRIGYITKWGVQKNFRVLFEAVAQLIGQGRSVRLVLTLPEDRPENSRVLACARAAGLGQVLENAGEVDAGAISALYDTLDIFAFPSLVELFGFPLVEAMAKGLPVVAADTPSNREIAADAVLYFPPANAQALAAFLGQMIDDPFLRAAKSAAAFQRARHFSWDGAAEQTLALFDLALGDARR